MIIKNKKKELFNIKIIRVVKLILIEKKRNKTTIQMEKKLRMKIKISKKI